MKSLSRVQLLVTPWTAAYQAPPFMDFLGKSTGVGCHRGTQLLIGVPDYLQEYSSIHKGT